MSVRVLRRIAERFEIEPTSIAPSAAQGQSTPRTQNAGAVSESLDESYVVDGINRMKADRVHRGEGRAADAPAGCPFADVNRMMGRLLAAIRELTIEIGLLRSKKNGADVPGPGVLESAKTGNGGKHGGQ